MAQLPNLSLSPQVLQGIANPSIPDIAGSFQQGREQKKSREFDEIAGGILANQLGTRFAEAAGIDPQKALSLAQAVGAPLNDEARLKNIAGSAALFGKLLESGTVPPEQVGQLMLEQAQQLESSGINTQFLMESGQNLMSGDPALIQREVEAFTQLAQSMGGNAVDPQKQINVLRSSLQKITAPIRLVESAFKKIQKSGSDGTASGDMALIFSFMRILDPGSTVRETEFAAAEQTTGIPGRVVNLYNKAWAGTRLNAKQRSEFIDQAAGLFEAQRETADSQIENILEQADEDQLKRTRVFGTKRLLAFDKRQANRAAPVAAVAQPVDLTSISDEELLQLRNNANNSGN